ncbi:MAG: hypothetical protein CSA38_02805 [Flavobacteriales bacterium]|nr:MAG: hypothetical protein CSA38_02805 [Flavobacteriales bacterium]
MFYSNVFHIPREQRKVLIYKLYFSSVSLFKNKKIALFLRKTIFIVDIEDKKKRIIIKYDAF